MVVNYRVKLDGIWKMHQVMIDWTMILARAGQANGSLRGRMIGGLDAHNGDSNNMIGEPAPLV